MENKYILIPFNISLLNGESKVALSDGTLVSVEDISNRVLDICNTYCVEVTYPDGRVRCVSSDGHFISGKSHKFDIFFLVQSTPVDIVRNVISSLAKIKGISAVDDAISSLESIVDKI